MTAIATVRAMTQALIGREVTDPELARIGASFLLVDPYSLGGWTEVDENGDTIARDPTNEEMAQLILDSSLYFLRKTHREAAEFNERQSQMTIIDAAIEAKGDESELDLV